MSNPTIYDQATKAVVKMLETAGMNWPQPWEVNGSRNVVTDKLYRGINTLILLKPISASLFSRFSYLLPVLESDYIAQA